jgi:outer membrane protein
MNRYFLSYVFLWAVLTASCQEKLTLQACLDQLETNSLQIAAESGSLHSSGINKQFHWWSLLPNLSGNAGFNTSFGRRLDPFTNTFATSSVNSQSFGLNSSVQLFDGFSYFYKRNLLTTKIERDKIGLSQKVNELKIQLIEKYAALCKLSLQTQLTESRIEKYNQLQNLQRLLLKEGRIHAIDTLRSEQSVLKEHDQLLTLRNESKLNRIQLNLLMNLPLTAVYSVDVSSVSGIEEKVRFTETYGSELNEVEWKLLETELRIERSAILPSISLNGLVGTGFSTNNKDYSQAGIPTKAYSRQINENLYEGIGFNLNIPLFNRGAWSKTKRLSAVQQTELSHRMELTGQLLEKQRLEWEQKRLDLRARQEQNKRMTDNLELIYQKSLLLYEAGRLTYREIELTLMEWQQELEEGEMLRFDLKLLELFE